MTSDAVIQPASWNRHGDIQALCCSQSNATDAVRARRPVAVSASALDQLLNACVTPTASARRFRHSSS